MGSLKLNNTVQSERYLETRIPYSHHVNETVIVTKEGHYLSTIKLAGRSFTGHSYETILRWIEEINTGFKGVASEHVSIHTHLVRKNVAEYPNKEFDNYFSTVLDQKYSSQFNGDDLLVNDLYITFIFRPYVGVNNLFKDMNKMSKEDRLEAQATFVEELQKIVGIFYAMFNAKKYQPMILGTYTEVSVDEETGAENEYVYCDGLRFYNYLLTREDRKVSVRKSRISDYIGNQRIFFSNQGEFGEIRKISGKPDFFAMLDVKEYPEFTGAGHINNLMKLPFEFVLSQSFNCLSKTAAKGFLKTQQKMLRDAKDMAESQIQGLYQAMDDLESGRFVMGEHYLTLQIFGKDIKQTSKNLDMAYAALTDLEFVMTRCDLSLESAFFSMLPANFKFVPRPAPISSFNFWSFNSLHNYMTGKPLKNPWGSAVCLMKTLSQSPLYFNFHSSPLHKDSTGKKMLGHTAILGQSGAGKTVLLAILLNYLNDKTKKAKQVIFDKDQGLSVYVQAVNGIYYTINKGEPTGWNPLQTDDIGFIKTFVKSLIQNDGTGINHYDNEAINSAAEILLKHSIHDRNLTVFSQALPNIQTDNEDRPTVFSRIKKWLRGEELGYLFDNDVDTSDLTKAKVFGFDVGDYIEDDEIREPIMTYLLNRTNTMIDGSPFVYVFDEFWKMLEAVIFEKLIKNELKTIRKKNGICIFATQEPNDVLSHPLAPTLVSQLATQILLENQKAEAKHYVEGLKLTVDQFQTVLDIPENSREFVIQQGGQISRARLSLDGKEFDDIMNVLSGTPDNALLVKKIKTKLATEKLQKIVNSEFSTESEIQVAKTMHWSQVQLDSSEWLPVYWNQLKELESIHA